jgi:hypothetical protein
MNKKIKNFTKFIKENLNNSQDPQRLVDSVLDVWMNFSGDEELSELIAKYESSGFKVLTLSQIADSSDIPNGSVVFSHQDDPMDLCYYKQGPDLSNLSSDEIVALKNTGTLAGTYMFEVIMGELNLENQEGALLLDEEDGSLEELLGVEFNDDSYEDLIIAVMPNSLYTI